MTSKIAIHRPGRWRPALFALGLAFLCGTDAIGMVAASGDTMRLALVSDAVSVAAGDTVEVELVVPVAGPGFNAYDAIVSYDSDVLTFLQRPDVREQQGELMWETCFQTFHLFTIAPDSSHVEINHSLLCSGATLTGPGVLYRLRFRARSVATDTWLRLESAPYPGTRVIDDGIFVTPLAVEDLKLQIAGGTAVPPAPGPGLKLRAAPNPFNPRTSLNFELTEASAVRLSVHRLDGSRVRTLVDRHLAAGPHTVPWDGTDSAGRRVSSGCYVVRMEAGDRIQNRYVTLLK